MVVDVNNVKFDNGEKYIVGEIHQGSLETLDSKIITNTKQLISELASYCREAAGFAYIFKIEQLPMKFVLKTTVKEELVNVEGEK